MDGPGRAPGRGCSRGCNPRFPPSDENPDDSLRGNSAAQISDRDYHGAVVVCRPSPCCLAGSSAAICRCYPLFSAEEDRLHG